MKMQKKFFTFSGMISQFVTILFFFNPLRFFNCSLTWKLISWWAKGLSFTMFVDCQYLVPESPIFLPKWWVFSWEFRRLNDFTRFQVTLYPMPSSVWTWLVVTWPTTWWKSSLNVVTVSPPPVRIQSLKSIFRSYQKICSLWQLESLSHTLC